MTFFLRSNFKHMFLYVPPTTITIESKNYNNYWWVRDGGGDPFYSLHAAEFDAIIAGITVLAMKLLIPDTNIRSIESIAELDMADATLEAVDVVEQQQRLDYHGSSATLSWKRKQNFHYNLRNSSWNLTILFAFNTFSLKMLLNL